MAMDDLYIATASRGINANGTDQRRRTTAAAAAAAAVTTTNGEPNIEGLLDGRSNHVQDSNRNIRRQDARRTFRLFRTTQPDGPHILPQIRLTESVVNQGLKRPRPKSW